MCEQWLGTMSTITDAASVSPERHLVEVVHGA